MRSAVLSLPALVLAAATAAGQPAESPITDDVLSATTARPARTVWATAEYLLWWNTPMNTPDLIQTVPAAVANANLGGSLPAGAATRVFPKDRQLDFGAMSGVRTFLGAYNASGEWGADVGFFLLETKTERKSLFSAGLPNAIARQYINVADGEPVSLYSSLYPRYAGGVTVKADTQTWGVEANARHHTYALIADRNEILGGFRYIDLQESIKINDVSVFPPDTASPNGSRLDVLDVVRTHNQFYGGQIGLVNRFGGCERGFGLDTITKFALGGMHQRAQLFGSNTFSAPGEPNDTENGGLYARPFNQGVFERSITACAVDFTANLTYNFSPRAKVFFGYSILWLSSVARPGEQIDPVINDSRVRFIGDPTQNDVNAPRFRWRANDYWVQGMNFGAGLAF